MLNLVKPKTCRRCAGKGSVVTRVAYAGQPGGCFSCGGTGFVESDKATMAAGKLYIEQRTALGKAAFAAGSEAHYGLGQLEVNAPDRCRKAVASFAAGRTDVIDALIAYGKAL